MGGAESALGGLAAGLPAAQGCRARALEEAVRRTGSSPRPSAVRLGARLDAYLAAESRLFLEAVRDGRPTCAFRPGCAERLEGAWLVHRDRTGKGPAWGLSARGRAALAAPDPVPAPVWRGVLARVPGAVRTEIGYVLSDIATALAILAFLGIWWAAVALDALGAAARLDGAGPLR